MENPLTCAVVAWFLTKLFERGLRWMVLCGLMLLQYLDLAVERVLSERSFNRVHAVAAGVFHQAD